MPAQIGNKEYFTVAERLTLARGDGAPPKGIQAISTRMEDHGGVVVIIATVVFADERSFTGMAMVKGDSRSSIEANSPVETAETSAVGRALAFAGYHGSPEGIAGYEEIKIADQRASDRASGVITPPKTTFFPSGESNVTHSAGASSAGPRPVGLPSPAQVRYANRLWSEAGRPMPPPDFDKMLPVEISRLIDDLKAEAAR